MNASAIENRLQLLSAKRTAEEANPLPTGTPTNRAIVLSSTEVSPLENYQRMTLATTPAMRPGLLGQFALGRQSLGAKLETAKAMQKAELAVTQHQCDAVERESLAYFRSKSAAIAEKLNTFLQEHLLVEETTRMENISHALEVAAEKLNHHLNALEDKPLADSLKMKLAEQLLRQYEATCERIQSDVLIGKYGASASCRM